ncbi:MAG: FxLD family lanthipeptide [Pseudonocardiaceae bacterium]
MNATGTENTVDAFALDVRVVTDVSPGNAPAPCGTDDGCAPTCASACNSNA